MNYKEFSSKIKTKYPQYSDMDDRELAEKISAKYPQYQVEYDEDTSTPAGSGRGTTVDLEGGTPYEDAGTLGALFPATLRQKQVGGGRVARAIATAGDAMSLLPRGVAALGTGLGALSGGRPLSAAYDEAMTELGRTKSEEEGALGLAQNVALDPTTWVPGAQVSKAKFLPALVKTAVQGAAGGVGSAAYQQAAEGEIDPGRVATQGAVSAALGAGTHGLGTAASKGVGRLLKGSAVRNVDIALRPGQFGRKIGYSGENVVKHDLVGSPRQVFELANQKLDELQSAAREIGSKSDETFNTSDIFESVKSTLNPRKNPEGYAKQVALLDDLEKQYSDVFGDVISAPDAMEMRTAIGKQTAFVGRSQGGVKIDPDASWKEDVYNKLYLKAKDDLHSKLGGELKEINRMQSEIIPVKMVAERRIPIAESNQRIGLSDLLTTRIGQGTVGGVIGAGVGAGAGGDDRLQGALTGLAAGAGLAAARRAYGSPAATRAMYGLGSRLAPEVAGNAVKAVPKKPLGTVSDALKPLKNQRGAVGSNDIITSVNPSGGIFTEYNPTDRASKMLRKNITTLDVTAKKNPDDYVTVYRGAPKSQKSIANGDFVTTNKQLALDYAGSGHVIEKKVKYSELLDDIDEPLGEEYILKENNQNRLLKNERGAAIDELEKYSRQRGSGAVPLLSGTAAAGLGGLTAYEYFKNRK